MKVLDRYIARELIIPFLIGTVAVTLMFDANLLIAYQKTLDLTAVPTLALVQYLIYRTPGFLNQTLPVGMALAGSLAISRLVRESELTAMRSAGVSILRVLRPVAIFGVVVAVGNFYIADHVMPLAERHAGELERTIGILVSSPTFTQNTYVQLDKFQAHIDSIQSVGNQEIKLTGIVLFSHQGTGQTLVFSPSGAYRDGVWTIQNATIYQLNGTDLVQMKTNQTFPINERISVADLFTPPAPEQMTGPELARSIASARKEGRSPQSLEVAYQVRYSVPAACILFGLVGGLFAMLLGRTGGFAGVLVSIFIVFLYFNAYIISTDILGKHPGFSPILAAWAPNIIFLVLGAVALRRIE